MANSIKPFWLKDYSSLMDTVNYNLFMPSDIPNFTTLQDVTAFNSGIKQFLFWKGQLLPSLKASTIFLAFLGPQGLKPPNVINITTALQDICNITQIVEFYQGANTNFLALSFTSKEPVTQIMSHFKFFDDAVVLSVTHDSTPHYRFRLLWLPPLFDINRVHHLLNRYSKTHRLKRESIGIAGGAFSPTNVISGTLTLEPGGDVSKLPHLIQLPSPHKGCALLTIDSRPPLCLKCRAVGHTRQKCTMVKCSKCTKVHFPSSTCGSSSYSSVASRNITPSTEDDWLAGLADVTLSPEDDSATPVLHDPPHHHTSVSHIPSNFSSSTHLIIPPYSDFPTSAALIASECDRTHDVSTTLTKPLISYEDTSSPPNLFIDDQSSNISSLKKQHQPKSSTPPLDSDSLIDSFNSATSISTSSSNPVVTFSRNKDSSKVHISDHVIPPSSIARSHIITYSVPPKVTSGSLPKKSSQDDSAFVNTLFGDPDPDHFFSSDSESASELPTTMDTSELTIVEPSTRKRKVSASSSDSLISVSDLSTPADFSSPCTKVSLSPIVSLPTPSMIPAITPLIDIDPGPVKSPSALHLQIADIFVLDVAQITFLEGLCPDGIFTTDIVKSLKLLSTHGISLSNISASPHILKLRFPEIKCKIKFLQKHLGAFSISDICQQEKLEDKVLAGSSVVPSGFFT